MNIAHTLNAAAVVETSLGEFEICEACYRTTLPTFFDAEDFLKIHYQFGLEYANRQEYHSSYKALTQARAIRETGDIMASPGYAQSHLGQLNSAKASYQRALEIDPGHFMARENLKNLTKDL